MEKPFRELWLRRLACTAMFAVAAASFSSPVFAEIRLPRIISDHMVLQCDHEVCIWGWANPGERVAVAIAGQTAEAVADEQGRWTARLAPLPASRDALEMTVREATGDSVTVRDVLIGEVWLGSGQSNMVMELPADRRQSPPATIRVFKVAQSHAVAPTDDVDGEWMVATPDSLASFSWVLYAFGQRVHDALQAPVGLIQSAWGGTPIQAWTPADRLSGAPVFENDRRLLESANAEHETALASFAAGSPADGAASPPKHPFAEPGQWPSFPTVLYNAMIHPLTPLRIRGILWYQGEQNVHNPRPQDYGIQMQAMIGGWRQRWSDETLPFYFVQIPPFPYENTNDPYSLTKLWQGQFDALSLADFTEIAPTMDVGDLQEIHTMKKDPVGDRLARIALHQVYGRREIVFRGPRYESHVIEDDAIRVKLRDVGSGLTSLDQKPLTWFQVAGDDGAYQDASAEIAGGDEVIVRSTEVSAPRAVRYGWMNVAQPNLGNIERLPALPFSTERW